MKANHIHLHCRDLEVSKAFYKKWFELVDGPDYGDIVFVRSAEGFDLALSADDDPAPLPPWFHWGFKLATAQAVRDLLARMQDSDVQITKSLVDHDDLVMFRCADPDAHQIELYWE